MSNLEATPTTGILKLGCSKLFWDLLRKLYCPGGPGQFNKSQCYYRIVHLFLSLASQRCGMPLTYIVTLLIALLLMTFFFRTGYSELIQIYRGTCDNPFHGLCQGSVSSPDLQLLIFSFIVQYLRVNGCIVKKILPIYGAMRYLTALIFVDNTDTMKEATIKEEVSKIVQVLSQIW